jgi:hypothetical protein
VNAEAGPDWGDLTTLQKATMGDHLTVVDILLKAAADSNAKSSTGHDGLSTLQAAAGGGQLDVAMRLLLVGADADAINSSGLNALQATVGHVVSRPWRSSWTQNRRTSAQNDAAAADNLNIVETLMRASASVNSPGSDTLRPDCFAGSFQTGPSRSDRYSQRSRSSTLHLIYV